MRAYSPYVAIVLLTILALALVAHAVITTEAASGVMGCNYDRRALLRSVAEARTYLKLGRPDMADESLDAGLAVCQIVCHWIDGQTIKGGPPEPKLVCPDD